MSEIIFVVEEAPEGGYTAHALGAGIYTEADTLEELRAMVRDAVRVHFDENERHLGHIASCPKAARQISVLQSQSIMNDD